MKKIDIIIPLWISLIVINYIIFTENTNMDTIEFILWSIICGTISMLIALMIWRVYETKSDKRKKIIDNHRKEIVEEILKKEFQNMNITFDTHDFKVLITDLKELKEKEIYGHTLQHLEAYPPILESWKKSEELIEKTNGDLGEFVNFVFKKIETDIDERHKKGLSYSIHHMVDEAIRSDSKKFSINALDDGAYINISLGGKKSASVNCKTYSRTKIKQFLTNLENEIIFQNGLTGIRKDYNDLKNEFDNNFKSEIRTLLNNIKGKEEDLKGKCDKRSFWKDC